MRASVGFTRLLRNALENVCCEHHTPAAVLKLCLRSGRDLHRCEFTNDLRAKSAVSVGATARRGQTASVRKQLPQRNCSRPARIAEPEIRHVPGDWRIEIDFYVDRPIERRRAR